MELNKMTKPTIRIHDMSTDEVIDREMTDEELSAYQAEIVKAEARRTAESEAEAKRAAILERLELTADEAKLLIG